MLIADRTFPAPFRFEPRSRLIAAWAFGLILARVATAQPVATLDLATVSPNDGVVRWVYGASGLGNQGVPVAGGHDCDGDGLKDYAVAHFKASPFSRSLAGEVDLVFGDGTTGGFVDTSLLNPSVLRIAGAGPREVTGSEIWIDDVTGDGLGDLLIARQNFTPNPARIGAGALTILVGGPVLAIRAASLETVDLGDPPESLTLTTVIGARALDRLGMWVRTGDVTGDGIADIVVGADQEDGPGEANRGAVYLIRGGSHLAAGGVIDLASFGSTALAGHLAKITPPPDSAGYHFGATCQIADLDGNGAGELLAAAALFRGGASILADGAPPGSAEAIGGAPHGALYIAWDDNFPAALWPAGYAFEISSSPGGRTVIRGATAGEFFGEEILGGGDYDADGRADLFIGDLGGDGSATRDRPLSGIGYVLYRAEDLKGLDFGLDNLPAGLRLTTILGPSATALGADTAADGDFDGDGFADLIFTSPHGAPQGRISAGGAQVLLGRLGGWPALIDTAPGRLPPASAVRMVEIQGASGTVGGDLGDTVGYSAAAADIDGDGRTDLITNEMLGNGITPGTVDVGNLIIISGKALAPEICVSGPSTLCLRERRFQLEVSWRDFGDRTGSGQVVAASTGDSGLFWFFAPANWELLVKVLDGCGSNQRFWVFSAATTNVEYTLRVTDVQTGAVKEYVNPLGVAAAAITDTDAFATCP